MMQRWMQERRRNLARNLMDAGDSIAFAVIATIAIVLIAVAVHNIGRL